MAGLRKRMSRTTLWVAFSMVSLFSTATMADVRGRCVPTPPCYCSDECLRCGPGGCGRSSTPAPTVDYEAERRRQEAEAAERKRKEEEECLRKEEEFRRERDAAASTLKGASGSGTYELKGSFGTDDHGLKGTESRIGRQLKSVEGESRDAAALDREASSEKASKGFDKPGSDRGTLVVPRISGKKPATPSALARKIDPRALQDPQVRQSLAWYEQLEKVKTETLQKLAEVRQQKKSGTGDKAVLAAHEQSLNNQLKDTEVQQVKTEQDAKKRVINLGFEWSETGTATAGDKSGARK